MGKISKEGLMIQKGTVKWWNDSKGFGFLIPSDGGKDVFAHYTELRMDGFKTLIEGQAVEFELKVSERGPEAKNIKLLEVA